MRNITYSYNFAGLIAYFVGALLIFGITPIAALSQNETIITGLLLISFLGESFTLKLEGRDPWLKTLVMVSFPVFYSALVYAFVTLVTG